MRGDFVIKNKKTVFIDKRAKIGKNVIIYENNRIEGYCEIADNVTIFPNCFIYDSIIGKGCKIYTSVIEKSVLGACVSVGPFSNVKGAKIDELTKIGSFCEIKNVEVEKSSVIKSFSSLCEDKKGKKR